MVQRASRGGSKPILPVILGLSAAVVVSVGVWALVERRETARLTALLAEARADVAAGRVHSAVEKLREIEAGQPGWEEVPYLLGQCEQARGRLEPALTAWRRVAPDGPFGAQAALELARAEMAQGRLGAAERRLLRFVDRAGPHQSDVRRTLITLLKLQDRRSEVARLIRAEIGDAPDPPPMLDATASAEIVEVLRQLWELEHAPFPVEAVRGYFVEMAHLDPEDDRVRLGLANLDARAGRFEEADRRVAGCIDDHPGDPVLWRARLDWARAARRGDIARACLPHVPLSALGNDLEAAAEVKRLEAWIAAERNDTRRERQVLTDLVALCPAELPALERLAELDVQGGRPEDATRWRNLKDQRDRDRSAYAALLRVDDVPSHAAELARLAESLGRDFDARWWAAVANIPAPRPRRLATTTTRNMLLAQVLPELPPSWSTAGGNASVANGATGPHFEDDATRAGLIFTFDQGRSPQRQLPETMSGGIGLIDYDNDGWLDVYAVQGGTFPPEAETGPMPGPGGGDRLFRNQRDGRFVDVTERAGLARLARGYGHGIAVGDIDNDRNADLFLTRWRSYVLLRNRGDGTFEEVTARWGLDGDRDWPTSAAFADFDNDGDLDLYVCHYLAWDSSHPRVVTRPESGEPYYATPAEFPSLADHLFRNDGNRFVDISEPSGIQSADRNGRGLGVVAADLDDDGWVDIYVANDMSSNYYFRNRGRRDAIAFEEIGLEAGLATAGSGGSLAGMGIACGDFNGDARPDLFVTNFFGESTTFYQNLNGLSFADRSSTIGLAALTRDLLGFGIVLLDADNDGQLDILTANGHVNDGRPQFPWMMPAQLLQGSSGGRLTLTDVSTQAGAPFSVPHLGRALACGDLDNDGRLDAVLVAQGEPLVYLHNQTPRGERHALTLRLEGTTSNRDGVGARVTLLRSGASQPSATAWRTGGGSFLAASDPRLHFGLGSDPQPVSVEIRWPSGQTSRISNLATDGIYRVVEGETTAHLDPGHSP